MKKRTLAVLSILAAVGLTATAALPAEASNPTLHFSAAVPNSPGSDTRSNASLNGEWVRLNNSSSSASYTLTGWTIRDKSSHVYTFGSFTLKPAASVTLYTGKGTNSSSKRYWGKAAYVWNNTGDEAYLKNATGTTKDTCSWGSEPDGKQVVC
ncbi:lamin tail domain-containing protein [Amnibacterium sp.]|uniref:lamin tail domain-containing protein n=1 Tax=Amnibacterium sp. TaxID=1872496 RepID=UPI00260369A5|nr:lamin tail domain-containing protein [Amnibacterium sp.]MCU1472773.1 hypothetical protein [Amnibacterium sp.]